MRYIIVNLILLILFMYCFLKKKLGPIQLVIIVVIINVLLTTGIDPFAKYFTFENMTRLSPRHFGYY